MFFNKAQNLEYLKNLNIKEINIPNFTFFSVLEWNRNNKLIIKNNTPQNNSVTVE